jgi:hypothetical protein
MHNRNFKYLLTVPTTKMYIHIVSQFPIKQVYTILNSCNCVIHLMDTIQISIIYLYTYCKFAPKRGEYSNYVSYFYCKIHSCLSILSVLCNQHIAMESNILVLYQDRNMFRLYMKCIKCVQSVLKRDHNVVRL